MNSIERSVSEKLKKAKTGVNLLVTDVDSYSRAIRGVLLHLVNEREMGGVYVSLTRPSQTIINRLQGQKMRLDDVFFVDCVSYLIEGVTTMDERIAYVESPTMLEIIMVKIDFLLRKIKSAKKFVFFDSINALSIYNSEKILAEFLHLLVNDLGGRDALSVLLSVKGQTPESIESMLKLICDKTIEVMGG